MLLLALRFQSGLRKVFTELILTFHLRNEAFSSQLINLNYTGRAVC